MRESRKIAMKRIGILLLGYILILICYPSYAQTDIGKLLDSKMDKAAIYLNKGQNTPKAWELAVEISTIIKAHPEYDDGEYAEGMIDLVTHLLTKPWKYTRPYLTGEKTTPAFQDFVINHVNELSDPNELKVIKKNVTKNCNLTKYPVCQKLITRINESLS